MQFLQSSTEAIAHLRAILENFLRINGNKQSQSHHSLVMTRLLFLCRCLSHDELSGGSIMQVKLLLVFQRRSAIR